MNECRNSFLFKKEYKNNFENDKMINLIKEGKVEEFSEFIFEKTFFASEVLNYSPRKLIFYKVVFKKNISFRNFTFNKEVKFLECDFRGYIDFTNSTFKKNITFKQCIFNKSLSDQKVFKDANFLGQNFSVIRCKNLPRMDGIKLDESTKVIMVNLDYDKNNYLSAKINYKIAKNQATKIGDYERIGYYYYKERAYGSRCMKLEDYPRKVDYISAKFFDYLAKYSVGYGERPWNILLVSVFTISIFALIYMLVGVQYIDGSKVDFYSITEKSIKNIFSTYIDFWYFSLVTFTTVGYGDMIVISSFGKILVSIEVFFGVTIAATWTSVIVKRMIR